MKYLLLIHLQQQILVELPVKCRQGKRIILFHEFEGMPRGPDHNHSHGFIPHHPQEPPCHSHGVEVLFFKITTGEEEPFVFPEVADADMQIIRIDSFTYHSLSLLR